jgi:oligopeptide transport system substrate-binding protein
VLSINIGVEVKDLDPHLVTGVAEHRVNSALFEGLTDLDPATLEPIPGAAESWTVSEDQLTYTFTLRPDGAWSNGDPVTAQDFHYSFQRMLSPALAADYAYLLHCIKNARAFNTGEITDFSAVGVRVVDDRTLVIELEHPTPYFLEMHMHQAWYPVHLATIEAHGDMAQRGTPWTRAGNHVGNGPFRLTAWWPNERLEVVRNEHYWGREQVALDGIVFYPIDDLQTEERSFRTGKIQMTSEVPTDKVATYQQENPEVLHIDPYLGVYFYRLNTTRAPFNDARVRQALSLATDREEIVRNVTKSGQRAAFHYVPPGIPGYTSDPKLSFNPDRARMLLEEAGYPNGEGMPPVEILYNTSENHKRIAEAIQQMWRTHLGVDVQLVNQDWKVYLDTTRSMDYTIARAAWIGDVVDPVNFLEMWLTDGGNNETGYSRPEYDALIHRAYGETDSAARIAVLKEAEAMILDDLPIIPIYFYTRKYLQAPEVQGYTPNVLGYLRFQEFYLAQPDTEAP